jgi:hypothetical protein
MDDHAAFMQVYNSLVEEHELTSVAHLAIARSLASLMVDDNANPVDTGRQIARLYEMLPRPKPATPAITKLEVELVASPHRQTLLEEENTKLRAELKDLKAALVRLDPRKPADADSSSPAAENVTPSNVVPIRKLAQDMSDDEKAARMKELRTAAGDGPQPLAAPRDVVGGFGLMPGVGAGRFDHPGWSR